MSRRKEQNDPSNELLTVDALMLHGGGHPVVYCSRAHCSVVPKGFATYMLSGRDDHDLDHGSGLCHGASFSISIRRSA